MVVTEKYAINHLHKTFPCRGWSLSGVIVTLVTSSTVSEIIWQKLRKSSAYLKACSGLSPNSIAKN